MDTTNIVMLINDFLKKLTLKIRYVIQNNLSFFDMQRFILIFT